MTEIFALVSRVATFLCEEIEEFVSFGECSFWFLVVRLSSWEGGKFNEHASQGVFLALPSRPVSHF